MTVITYEWLYDYASGAAVGRGGKGKIRCPVPDHGRGRGDQDPSLHVSLGDDGRVLLHCQVGCGPDAILAAWGVDWRVLFPPDLRRPASPSNSVRTAQGTQGTQGVQGHVTGKGSASSRRSSKQEDVDEHAEVEHFLRLHASGRFEVEVERAPRPRGLSGPAEEVLRLYELVLAVRRWAGVPEPYDVLFAQHWVARWTGMPRRTVRRALDELQRATHPLSTSGLLVLAGAMPPRGQRYGTRVFRPGWLVDVEPEAAGGAVVAGGPELDEEFDEDGAVPEAVAPDVGEALEVGDGLGAAVADAGGGYVRHDGKHKPMPSGWNSDPDCPF